MSEQSRKDALKLWIVLSRAYVAVRRPLEDSLLESGLTEGEFGVLEGHAPFMSTISDGALKVYRTENAQPEEIRIQGGFAEVGANGLTVLAEHVEG